MLLADWLTREGVTRTEFARRIDVQPSHITGLCNGASWPSRRVANAIERETSGNVTASDFQKLGETTSEEAAD